MDRHQCPEEPACERCAHLTRALISRGTIEQAKGMLMHAWGVDGDEAFGMLVKESQRQNRKLSQITVDLVGRRLDPHLMTPPDP